MSITSVSSADLSDDPDEELVQLDNEPRSNTGSTAIRRRSGVFFFLLSHHFKIKSTLILNIQVNADLVLRSSEGAPSTATFTTVKQAFSCHRTAAK
jgi:hypothetical protein